MEQDAPNKDSEKIQKISYRKRKIQIKRASEMKS